VKTEITAEVKDGVLNISVPVSELKLSSSGNSKLFATGSCKIQHEGKNATVQVNGYIPIKEFV